MRLATWHLAWSLAVASALATPLSVAAQSGTVSFPITTPPLELPIPTGRCALDESKPGDRAGLQRTRRQLTQAGLDTGRIVAFLDCGRIAEAQRTNNYDIAASSLAVVHVKNFNFRRTGLKSREFAAEQCSTLKGSSGELPVAGTPEWKAELLRRAQAKGDSYLPVVHQAGRVCYSALVEKGDVSFVAFTVVRGMGLMVVATNYEQQDPQGLVAHFEMLRGYMGMLQRTNPLRRPPGPAAPTEVKEPATGTTPTPGAGQQRPTRQ